MQKITAVDVIHELDGDDHFLELDDPEDPVMLEGDDEFRDLEGIDEDDQKGNDIHSHNQQSDICVYYLPI